ncbi:Uncharacterized conserved protein [Geodermatophilus sabuli]|uniref:Uncharacterized conserved protein n=2 Tax=Geodermatophilus sabuli TaxID=1564158 RepID=A0A285EJZ5_9ACTN|nr:Uncharacterized conserved protein [Geodermatophilus sabuli]
MSSVDSGSPERAATHRRAVEAVMWGMPAVNYQMMYEASARTGGPGDNQIVFWPGLLDGHNQTLTPNPDVIYLMPFFTTKQVGPIVLEVPPAGDEGSLNGSIMNYWQVALEDIGPAGVDEGTGGRCLILPPDFDGEVPAGYLPLRSDTYQGYGLIRSVLRSGSAADIDQAIAYAHQIKLYPLAEVDDPPETDWVDASGSLFDAAIPYDLRFFQALDRTVQAEPFLHRDRVMINQLRSIGIQRGTPFAPGPELAEILTAAAADAQAWIDAEYEKVFHPFTPTARWALPALPELITATEANFEQPDAYPVDARGVAYSFAFFSSKHLGKGQFYLMTIADEDGKALDGANTYRLTVPADAPVTQYWSVTVYDRATHTLIRDAPRAGCSSQAENLTVNDDGSTDIYFGPTAPAGSGPNWVPTDPGGRFEALFRFYGPTSSLYDHTWRLPDIGQTPAAR